MSPVKFCLLWILSAVQNHLFTSVILQTFFSAFQLVWTVCDGRTMACTWLRGAMTSWLWCGNELRKHVPSFSLSFHFKRVTLWHLGASSLCCPLVSSGLHLVCKERELGHQSAGAGDVPAVLWAEGVCLSSLSPLEELWYFLLSLKKASWWDLKSHLKCHHFMHLYFIEANFLITGISFSIKTLFLPFCMVGLPDYNIEVYFAAGFLFKKMKSLWWFFL